MISLDHVIEIVLLLLGCYLAGCVFGYCARLSLRHLTMRRIRTTAAAPLGTTPIALRSTARRLAQVSAREEAVIAAPVSQALRPPQLPAPRGGAPDDLTRIKGVGPKTEAALNDLGVYHFDQIAAWHAQNLDWLDGRVAIKGRIRREQWVEQAVLLATELPLRKAS
ncbi:MAG: hypothetical protein ABS75_24035 [Pelagibacterium sp. SCN 63-23]|nr:MAG: hypothetical protein ABS75_24035 [Pelagibacterium sp. SCN 63-23]